MSKLGIGLLYFALVGALAAAAFGYLLIQKYETSKGTLATTQQQLTSQKKETVAANKKVDEETQAADDANSKLTEANSKVDDLTGKLADEQKKEDDLNTKLTAAQTDADTAKKALADINTELGMSPADMKTKVAQAESALATANSQLKIAQDQSQSELKQINDLKDAINRKATASMPGISGKITFVNRPWNFVVLNVGLANGVVPNGELIVYRGRNFIGKIKITSAEDNTSVADILPDAKQPIQVGDDVLN
jgi:hypothetical protein